MALGTIHLIAGPWASGKSELASLLATRVPEAVVFDWDLIIPGLSRTSGVNVHETPSTWDGLRATWATILKWIAATGRDAVLLGPATPASFHPCELGEGPIRCAYLDWPDATLANRLRDRGRSEQEICEEIAFAETLRNTTYFRVDLAGCDPAQMADRVAAWVRLIAS